MIRELYGLAEFCQCRDLEWQFAAPGAAVPKAAAFDDVLDLRDFAFDPAFRGQAMMDYFLARLGVDPQSVTPGQRRIGWLAPRIISRPPPIAPGYVLICPRASMALRMMPDRVHTAVLDRLAGLGVAVATQGRVPPGGTVVAAPTTASLAALCGWVAGAGLVVSTDTAIVHLTDALSVPCLAVFTTHRPQWRARDYPLCRALYRPVAGLPEALEFARDPDDVAAAQAAWLDPEGGLDDPPVRWLTDAVAEAVHAAGDRIVRPGRA